MLILTLRTDRPEAEIGLYEDDKKLHYENWQAHRELAETIHTKIREQLALQELFLQDVGGIVVFKGPGSFTGLRIGLTVLNTIAASESVPIVGELGEAWQQKALDKLQAGNDEKIVLPFYGSDAHITKPRK